MTVWKVVYVEGGIRMSYLVLKDTAVIYAQDVQTKPLSGCGPLCAFTTLDRARDFRREAIHSNVPIEIWEASAEQSKEKAVWSHVSRVKFFAGLLPNGTVLCDSITLVRMAVAVEWRP